MADTILARLAQYLRVHRRASLADLAIRLDAAPDALAAMLAAFERKGRVRRMSAAPACGSTCCKCDPSAVTVYEWTGQ